MTKESTTYMMNESREMRRLGQLLRRVVVIKIVREKDSGGSQTKKRKKERKSPNTKLQKFQCGLDLKET